MNGVSTSKPKIRIWNRRSQRSQRSEERGVPKSPSATSASSCSISSPQTRPRTGGHRGHRDRKRGHSRIPLFELCELLFHQLPTVAEQAISRTFPRCSRGVSWIWASVSLAWPWTWQSLEAPHESVRSTLHADPWPTKRPAAVHSQRVVAMRSHRAPGRIVADLPYRQLLRSFAGPLQPLERWLTSCIRNKLTGPK